MSNTPGDDRDELSLPISRRALLGTAVAAGTVLAVGGLGALASGDAIAAAPAPDDFLRLSEFLTGGKPLDAGLAPRYWAAMASRDAKLGDAVSALQAYVANAKAANIDELLTRADLTEPLRKTMTQIVSSWYLGIVGVDADAELVSYADALMYRPTADVLVVPTYGGGPDSWGAKPAYLDAQPTGKAA